jgi:hypothetical protein
MPIAMPIHKLILAFYDSNKESKKSPLLRFVA